jgi:phosphoglycerate dehydrogenase-like enzyme
MAETKRTVFVASQYLNAVASILEKSLPDVDVHVVTFQNSVPGIVDPNLQVSQDDIKQLRGAEILITDSFVIGQLMVHLPKLKWIQTGSAGVDPLIKLAKSAAITSNNPPSFIVTRFTGDTFASLMFEYSFCFIVNYERGFLKQIPLKSSRSWSALKSQAPQNYRMVRELTIAILGIGSIGSRLAEKFRNHGTRVIGYGRRERPEPDIKQLGLDYYSTSLESVLSSCDYVISVLPHTPGTAGLLNEKFSFCQKSPVFINLGRGSVVDTNYLLQSLDQKLISHAVLDVFEQEPLPESSPLWTHEHVTITPHVSCETRPSDVAAVFTENLRKFDAGEAMDHVFDWQQLY